jgi:hypothetical protein
VVLVILGEKILSTEERSSREERRVGDGWRLGNETLLRATGEAGEEDARKDATERKNEGQTGSPAGSEGSREDKFMIWSRSQIFDRFGRRRGEFSQEDSP